MPVVVGLTNGDVLIIVCLVAIPIATMAFVGAGALLKQIGKGQFAIEQELPQKTGDFAPSSRAEREAEVRQMLEAKSYRRVAKGGEALDVDAEVAKLVGGGPGPGALDPGLRDEVRQHVIARNERRERRGEKPLDVNAEIERQLREVENLGH